MTNIASNLIPFLILLGSLAVVATGVWIETILPNMTSDDNCHCSKYSCVFCGRRNKAKLSTLR